MRRLLSPEGTTGTGGKVSAPAEGDCPFYRRVILHVWFSASRQQATFIISRLILLPVFELVKHKVSATNSI